MTRAEFVSLEKKLLPVLPGFAIKGSLIFVPPVRKLLRGISFEGSSFDKASFYINFFVFPLCVPTEHLYFNFGNRVRKRNGGDRWSKEDPKLVEELRDALKQQALPFLSRAKDLAGFAELAASFSSRNPHTATAIGFALARASRSNQAVEVLGQLQTQLDLSVEWQRAIGDLSKHLRAKLITDPEGAQQQLEAWEGETVRNLGLEEFR
jgi:hypothetical protein